MCLYGMYYYSAAQRMLVQHWRNSAKDAGLAWHYYYANTPAPPFFIKWVMYYRKRTQASTRHDGLWAWLSIEPGKWAGCKKEMLFSPWLNQVWWWILIIHHDNGRVASSLPRNANEAMKPLQPIPSKYKHKLFALNTQPTWMRWGDLRRWPTRHTMICSSCMCEQAHTSSMT